jgi:hypothetical protein
VAAGAGGAATTMTDARRPSKPPARWVFVPALGAFFAALALLAFEVRVGQDPALGPGEPIAQTQTRPRRVLVRRVIERVVIHHPATGSSAAAVRTPAPTTTRSAPAPAAPAPAPAPLTTQSS